MTRQAEALVPTEFGKFRIIAYAEDSENPMPHLAIIHTDMDNRGPVYIRIHSECITGDIFHSNRCDCGDQLIASLQAIEEHKGVVIYLRQEGRGIGIINKLRAYNLQDEGLDTAEANTHLGFEADARIYNDAIEILKDLKISTIYLLTNNPDKVRAFDSSGIEVVSRVPLVIPPKAENLRYYEAKRDIFGHSLDW
jgi:GTP cyclohydrolase II